MGVNLFKIKKWSSMLLGKSILHVNQNLGTQYRVGEVSGYFNNMVEKVTKNEETLKNRSLPKMFDDNGREVVFPVCIFQYGLGAYDLYLQTKEEIYLEQFWKCAEWACEYQTQEGAWSMAEYVPPDAPYGAMCQGEGTSVLLRAYKQSGNKEYLDRATKAIDFMLLPIEQGGTSLYSENETVLMEFTNRPCVYNGWVFAIFGLYELVLTSRKKIYEDVLNSTLTTLKNKMPLWDCGYWSLYNEAGAIASPFYHDLHIAQLEALDLTFPNYGFGELKDKFVGYRNNWLYKKIAFGQKAIQKIME